MKLENQVVSLELAKKLKELGFEPDSLFYWDIKGEMIVYKQGQSDWKGSKRFISAYTVAELGEMLGKSDSLNFMVAYLDVMDLEAVDNFAEFGHNLIVQPDILAQMLIYLRENKLI